MKIAALSVVLVATCLGGQVEAVCDPDVGCASIRTPAPSPTPVATVRTDQQAAELGLHAVNVVWSGDVVTKQGSTTTYTTDTQQRDAGTYAKLVSSVGTGQVSAFDQVVFNGRTTLSNGQRVAGDVYASYVVRGGQVVFDRYVFFQDDRETSLVSAIVPVVPSSDRPAAPVAALTLEPIPQGVATGPGSVPGGTVTAPPQPTFRQTPRPRNVTAGVALEPQGDLLSRIEILRGYAIDLWLRARIDGDPATVTAWRLVSGEVTAFGPVSGSGDVPLRATWRTVTGSPFRLRFAVDVRVPGEGTRTTRATIEVVVRSPALIQ